MANVIGGFRIERLLGRGELGPVYEAVQLSLGRRVALRLLAGDSPPVASVDHPNIVPVYEAGEWEGRPFAVSRLVRGRTLADLLDAGSLTPARFDELVDAVSDALAAAHRAGVTHGRLSTRNVIVDGAGTPFVADLGLAPAVPPQSDLAALGEIRAQRPGRSRRSLRPIAAAVATALVGAGLLVAISRDGGEDAAARPVAATGCAPEPDANTPACTLSQAALGGREVAVRDAGVVRRWTVEDAHGELSLQVLRERDGRTVRVGFSQPVRVSGAGSGSFPVDLNVKRGDRIGVLLGPGARIGVSSRRRGKVQRWDGGRTPLPRPSAFAGELLLRADVRHGERAEGPPQLTGSRAAGAPPGRVLAKAQVETEGTGTVDVKLVRAGRSIALDAFRGSRRRARVAVPDAGVGGRLRELTSTCEYRQAICLQWLNEGETIPLTHAYTLARGGRRFEVIG